MRVPVPPAGSRPRRPPSPSRSPAAASRWSSVEHSAAGPVVAGHATELAAGGAVVPALAGGNIPHARRVIEALRRALDRAGLRVGTAGRARRPRQRRARVAPDRSSRCRQRPDDLDQLMRWQLKKATPFPIEEAQVSYFPVARIGAGRSRWRPSSRGATSSRNTRRSPPRPASTRASSTWPASTS